MPSYSVSHGDIHDEIRKLERKGETIVSVVADGDGAWIVVTAKSPKVETR